MVKLLIGIMTAHHAEYTDPTDSCQADYLDSIRFKDLAARREACRETWIPECAALGIDVKFFFGRPTIRNRRMQLVEAPSRTPLDDEVFLDCGDLYRDNSYKVQAICQWALLHDYDYLLRTDDDSFLYPKRLLQEEWRQYDYSGAINGDPADPGSYISGGALFLSATSMQILANTAVTMWCDDVWIGKVLRSSGVPIHTIDSMNIRFGDQYVINPDTLPLDHQYSLLHSCTPSTMYELHKRGR